MSDTKRCSKCAAVKPVTEFYHHKACCKECYKTIGISYRAANPGAIKAKKAAYYAANKEKIRPANAAYRAANKAAQRARAKKRRDADPNFRLAGSLRARFHSALDRNSSPKRSSAVRDLGCTVDELWSMLQPDLDRYGFTRADHGTKFHIDHIIPFASHDLQCRGQQLRVNHYSNLGVLSAEENLSKGDTDPHEWASGDGQREAFARYVMSA